MESSVNTGVEPLENSQDTKQDKKVDGENTSQADGDTEKDKTNGTNKPDEPEEDTTKKEESTTDKKKRRTHKKFMLSVNVSALKALEGITTSSFLDIVKAVILIDGKPYNKILPHYLRTVKSRLNAL